MENWLGSTTWLAAAHFLLRLCANLLDVPKVDNSSVYGIEMGLCTTEVAVHGSTPSFDDNCWFLLQGFRFRTLFPGYYLGCMRFELLLLGARSARGHSFCLPFLPSPTMPDDDLLSGLSMRLLSLSLSLQHGTCLMLIFLWISSPTRFILVAFRNIRAKRIFRIALGK